MYVKKVRVLVVDDSKMSHMMLDGIMSKTNFEICGYAMNCETAVEKYQELQPDVVTMDMNLPDADGLECSKRILTINPQAKIIMISAMKDTSLMIQGRAIGIRSFLQKPLSPNDLIDTLIMVCQSNDEITVKRLEESYVQAFVKVIQKNLFSLAGVHCKITAEIAKEEKIEINGIGILIGLTGMPVGRIILHTDLKTMHSLARIILAKGDDDEITEDEASACIEETANIIAGHSVSMINDAFKDKELRITPPGIIIGEKLSMVNPKLIAFNVLASTSFGDLKMNIGFAGGE